MVPTPFVRTCHNRKGMLGARWGKYDIQITQSPEYTLLNYCLFHVQVGEW